MTWTLEHRRRKAVEYQLALRRRKMALVRAYKAARACRDCGETDPVVLELHHRDPAEKHPRLRKRTRSGHAQQRTGGDFWVRLSYAEIATELEKCDVMCANCHRRETHRQREEARSRANAMTEFVETVTPEVARPSLF